MTDETWPSQWLVESWQGDFGFQFRPGEDGSVHDPVAAEHFRETLGRFATCQSFTSVSLDPPLVLFCPAKTSRAWPRIEGVGTFCVNILATDQQHVSDVMATRGIDKFAGLSWKPSPKTGSPVIDVISMS